MFWKKARPRELELSEEVLSDPKAVELARVWAADGRQVAILNIGAFKDPAAWGIALADLARHASNGYREHAGIDSLDSLSRIRAAFDAELKSPTSDAPGRIRG